ncbi:hypothetical protein DUNSADRAFT_15732 [Dunaliella salina]|uniref:SET domain-containing protein n=1 Tax=Dunaliella salina TaxID=3046 RepID=A0ABQ7H9A7_DUNSA|nr:hypothetical protein DUNSADRAFT_15732 [Dunaliella salina]|eukprot:KAF5843437.1 hypothetical protein DUNSADRAFT_15732 [Dunaliella salina]
MILLYKMHASKPSGQAGKGSNSKLVACAKKVPPPLPGSPLGRGGGASRWGSGWGRKLQTPPPLPASTPSPKQQGARRWSSSPYKKWLDAAAIEVRQGVRLEGRGLIAGKDLSPGPAVLVPLKAQIRADTIPDPRLHDLLQQIPHHSAPGLGHVFSSALALLWHVSRGAKSPFYAHIQQLPGIGTAEVPCAAPIFPEKVLPELQDNKSSRYVCQVKAQCKDFWEGHIVCFNTSEAKNPFLGLQITHALWGWAVTLSQSRCFDGFGMPPLIDFANHSPRPNCTTHGFTSGNGFIGPFMLELTEKCTKVKA